MLFADAKKMTEDIENLDNENKNVISLILK